MRLKWFGLAAAASCLMLIPGSSFADTTTLTLTSTPGEVVGGVYVYPYDFTVGSTTDVALMCLDYGRHITSGETWTVNVESIAAAGAVDGDTTQYEEDAWLYSQMNGSNDADVQLAVWAIFDPTDAHGNSGWDSNAAMLASNAITAIGSLPPSFFDSFVVYIPTGDQTGWTDGIPQRFMGPAPTPEPSSLALFGTGLLGAVGILKRKMRQA
jgi:hypothetical protein